MDAHQRRFIDETTELVWLVRRVLERAERAPWEDAGGGPVKQVYVSRVWVEHATNILRRKLR